MSSTRFSYVSSVPLPQSHPQAVDGPAAEMSGGVITVLVLGALCLVLGVSSGYIYYTRINPRSSHRIRKSFESAPACDQTINLSTHLFLFEKNLNDVGAGLLIL